MILLSLGTAVARTSDGSRATHELVWPQLGEPGKARFFLHDEKEGELWDLLGESGLTMDSDLTSAKTRLKEALEKVVLACRAMSVDLPCVAEVSSL